LIFSTNFVRDIIIDTHMSLCKVRITFVTFQLNSNLPDRFSKNTQISNLLKIHLAGVELFHVDGQTDMAKLIIALRKLVKASNTR